MANELDSTVAAYQFDPLHGTLHAESIGSLLPDDFTGESRAAGIAQGGNTLFVSNRGHDSVASRDVNAADGDVMRRRWTGCLGTTPRFLTLTPDGSNLVVANEVSDSVVRWRVGAEGSLAEDAWSPRPAVPSAWRSCLESTEFACHFPSMPKRLLAFGTTDCCGSPALSEDLSGRDAERKRAVNPS